MPYCARAASAGRWAAPNYDETLRIWDVASREALAVWPQSSSGYIALALHPAGEILAVSCGDQS